MAAKAFVANQSAREFEARARQAAAMREAEPLALRVALLIGGHDPQPDLMPWRLRTIQNAYKANLKDPATGSVLREDIAGYFFAPTTFEEGVAFFLRQIEVKIAANGHLN